MLRTITAAVLPGQDLPAAHLDLAEHDAELLASGAPIESLDAWLATEYPVDSEIRPR